MTDHDGQQGNMLIVAPRRVGWTGHGILVDPDPRGPTADFRTDATCGMMSMA